MSLSKTWTTVTPLSKALAIILFVSLPVVAFFFGRQYQELVFIKNGSSYGNRCALANPVMTPAPLPEEAGLWQKLCTQVDPSVYDQGAVSQCAEDVYKVSPGPEIVDGDAYLFNSESEKIAVCVGMPSPEERKMADPRCFEKCPVIGTLSCPFVTKDNNN